MENGRKLASGQLLFPALHYLFDFWLELLKFLLLILQLVEFIVETRNHARNGFIESRCDLHTYNHS